MFISISRRANVQARSQPRDARKALPDGLVSERSCTRFLPGNLKAGDFEDGAIRLFFDEGKSEWRVETAYRTPKMVEPSQLDELVKLTLGQWSDGLGEGCFDEAALAAGVSIDLFPIDADDTLFVQVDNEDEDQALAPATKPSLDLYRAAEAGDLVEVTRLLDAGADIEFGEEGHTPLHNAVLCGCPDVALLLLERGSDPRAVYAGFGAGKPVDALMEAALSNSLTDEDAATVAEALLKAGVDPNGERDGYTPLVMAEVREKKEMMAVLRRYGATA